MLHQNKRVTNIEQNWTAETVRTDTACYN